MFDSSCRYWDQKGHPISRFAGYLVKKGLWSEAREKEWKETSRKEERLRFIRNCFSNVQRHLTIDDSPYQYTESKQGAWQ